MSTREPELVQLFWEHAYGRRGALLHEFPLLDARLTPIAPGYRLIPRRGDAVLLPSWPETQERTFMRLRPPFQHVPCLTASEKTEWKQAVTQEWIIFMQAKEHRLGMGVIGQAVFGAALISAWQPARITT